MVFLKDPNATLDYTVDWTEYLDDDTIVGAVWTVPSPLVNEAESYTTKTATVWISGGVVGVEYKVTCRITTTQGRIDDRTIKIEVRER